MAKSEKEILGVYATHANGDDRLVHRYQGGDYGLEEVAEYFQLGEIEATESEDETILLLTKKELRELKMMADAHSFDYEEGFIEMCLEMQRFAAIRSDEKFRFRANF